ncbi:arylsulfatase B-like [Achroia grisella]|uniref:arylsulfatase B-like n=1 Tax=Achroia grisella TaxID=688607 RepID=UPI0027D34950|nr:arylsulfatase B-like [Achroia grisella]
MCKRPFFNVIMGMFCIMCIMVVLIVYLDAKKLERPNIVFIIADDLGWNDVGFHGSDQIPTPNIDLLAQSGIALERYYTHCICTPSRSALLTGKYAHTTGMQGYPLTNGEDRGLPTTEKIMPQYFKDLGYATHLIGKWHVGISRTEFLPTVRGFDNHFGHRGGFIDYYEYTLEEEASYTENGPSKVSGMCLYRNLTPAWDVEGYITDVYTDAAKSIIESHEETKPLFLMVAHNAPHSGNDGALLQAPHEDVRSMRHVESPERRIYAAMVKKLDESVGDILEALYVKGILENTIIVFITDNGGMTSGPSVNYASNWPLRGLKMSPFEGGVRGVGLLWTSSLLPNHLWNGYIHVSDWLPTLLRAVGAEPPPNLDGLDLWKDIELNKPSSRKEMFEIDDYVGYASIISGDFKLVIGNVTKEYSNHQGWDLLGVIGASPLYEDNIRKSKTFSVLEKIGMPFDRTENILKNNNKVNCNVNENNDSDLCYPENDKLCLFNIKEDPCERRDVSQVYPELVMKLKKNLENEMAGMKPRTPIPMIRDPRSAPSLFNYTWAPFADDL